MLIVVEIVCGVLRERNQLGECFNFFFYSCILWHSVNFSSFIASFSICCLLYHCNFASLRLCNNNGFYVATCVSLLVLHTSYGTLLLCKYRWTDKELLRSAHVFAEYKIHCAAHRIRYLWMLIVFLIRDVLSHIFGITADIDITKAATTTSTKKINWNWKQYKIEFAKNTNTLDVWEHNLFGERII